MNDLTTCVQAVIDTLQDLDIKSTYNNLNRLMGAMQMLFRIRESLQSQAKKDTEPNVVNIDTSEG